MAKLLGIMMALIFAFFTVGIFSVSIYESSPDINKTTFTDYSQVKSYRAGNLTFNNTGIVTSNIQLAAESMAQKLDESLSKFGSDSIQDKLQGAFGVITTLVMDTGQIFLLVVIDGFNLVAGVVSNLTKLPAPWTYVGIIGGLAMVLIVVYIVVKVIGYITGREI